MDPVSYKNYRIYLGNDERGWMYHARPADAGLPILNRAFFGGFDTERQALDDAEARIDRLLK